MTRWRTLTSAPTVAQPRGKCRAIDAADAISIARIIIGAPKKANGMPSKTAPTVSSRRNRDLAPAGHADAKVLKRLALIKALPPPKAALALAFERGS